MGLEIKGQITYLDIDNNPLVEFVEGIMSYEKEYEVVIPKGYLNGKALCSQTLK